MAGMMSCCDLYVKIVNIVKIVKKILLITHQVQCDFETRQKIHSDLLLVRKVVRCQPCLSLLFMLDQLTRSPSNRTRHGGSPLLDDNALHVGGIVGVAENGQGGTLFQGPQLPLSPPAEIVCFEVRFLEVEGEHILLGLWLILYIPRDVVQLLAPDGVVLREAK